MRYNRIISYGRGTLPQLIDVKNSIAFGDSENDIPMLKAAGIGIAMKNAEMDVKKASDMCTLSNKEDGIPYALSELNVI